MKDILTPLIDKPNPFSSLIILAVAVFAGILMYFLFFRVIWKIFRKSGNENVKHIRRRIQSPALFVLITLSLVATMPLMHFTKPYDSYYQHFITLLMIFTIAWLSIKIVTIIEFVILKNYDTSTRNNLRARKVATQLKVFQRILIVVIVIIAFSTALLTFNKIRQVGVNLLASAGIAGIIIGFAAQKSLGLILAGFQIAITQPIRLDDVVIVEGEWGWIEEITLTYVVVRIWDKRRLIVPVTYFIEKPFQNWTRVSSDILGTVFIYTDYTLPVDKLRDELTNILESTSLWDGKVNVLQVTGSGETTMELRALMSAIDSPTAWDLRVYVREKLITFLQQNYPEALPRTRLEIKNAEKDQNSA